MEKCSSGEDLLVKVRKPYTITKQRERWTDEEHRRFLEAVKLYGRAWQKIEEHVGTKTAIQIRSHAQKFFTKLEKEALIKGIPLRAAHDIDIPPPRPKRKPSNPYPRKTCIVPKLSSGESICSHYQREDSRKDDILEKATPTENDHSSAVLTLFEDAPSTSLSSVNKGLGSLHFPREIPSQHREVYEKSVQETTASMLPDENREIFTAQHRESSNCSQEERHVYSPIQVTSETMPGGKTDAMGKISDQAQVDLACKNFFPLHFSGNENEKNGQVANADLTRSTPVSLQAAHSSSNIFAVPSFAALIPPIALPTLPSCALFQNRQHGYPSFTSVPPPFSDVIVSTLQQNPAVHEAARLAAFLSPSPYGDISPHSSEPCNGGIPGAPVNTSPSIATIAAATVAAATAWWAMHGLVPICPPLPAGFSIAPLSMVTSAAPESNHTANVKDAGNDASLKVIDAHPSDGQTLWQSSANMSPQQSDSDESAKYEDTNAIGLDVPVGNKTASALVIGCQDSSIKARPKKQDRSSCGSNTTCSSDDAEIMLDNHNKTKEEVKNIQVPLLSGENSGRRSRSSGCINESWKEVSEEGRLAFQALFSREVLPQSFSPSSKDDMAAKSNKNDICNTSFIDTSSKRTLFGDKLDSVQDSDSLIFKGGFLIDKSLSLCHSAQGKMKARRTGFKPYKRCSLETKDLRTLATEEQGAKRVRLEDEASS